MASGIISRWLGIGAAASAVCGAGLIYQPTIVVGNSMSPTLRSGGIIWIDRTYYLRHRPQRGEVVVFHADGQTCVKRVYRGPGEKVYYLANDSDWLGLVRESYAPDLRERYRKYRSNVRVKEMRVPDDCIFVLGDNLSWSEDSRQMGPIPISDLVGRAHLPVDRKGTFAHEFHRRMPRGPARLAADEGIKG